MLRSFLEGLYQILRSIVNFGGPAPDARNVDDICRRLRALQLDVSDPGISSEACVYVADPHDVPRPAGTSGEKTINISPSNYDVDEMLERYFRYETNEVQERIINEVIESTQSHSDDMLIASDSDSDFEEKLQNFFKSVPESVKPESSPESRDVNISELYSPGHFNYSSLSPASDEASPGFSSSGVTSALEGSSRAVSNDENSGVGKSSGVRKRRMTEQGKGDQSKLTDSNPSTPLSAKSDPAGWRRVAMLNSATRTKIRQTKERALRSLNLSGSGGGGNQSAASPKEETPNREQGAIAKHIARIRTSSSKSTPGKETSPGTDDTLYYSMNASVTDSAKSMSSSCSSSSNTTLSP